MSAPRCAWCEAEDDLLAVADGDGGTVYACTPHRERLGLEPLPPTAPQTAARILREGQ